LLKLWMSDADLEVVSDWKAGSPISIRGKANGNYEYKGTILKFEPGKVLQYNSWVSISRLPDLPENYSIVEFTLAEKDNQTELKLTHSNLIAEAAFEHSRFYWRTALGMIKKIIEEKRTEK
jgi:hypothetical protein